MIESGHGSIVTISSAVGTVGHWRRSAYCAAKGGVENLTRAMALDHGAQGSWTRARVSGWISTPLHSPGTGSGDRQELCAAFGVKLGAGVVRRGLGDVTERFATEAKPNIT